MTCTGFRRIYNACSEDRFLSFLYVCMVNTIYLLSFVETPRKFIIAELSIRKLGSSYIIFIYYLHILYSDLYILL